MSDFLKTIVSRKEKKTWKSEKSDLDHNALIFKNQ